MIQTGVSNEEIDRYLAFVRDLRALRALARTDAPSEPVPTSHLEREQMKIQRPTKTKNPRKQS